MESLIGGLLGVAVCGALGSALLSSAGRGTTGLLLGCFLGPLGVIVAGFLRLERLQAIEPRSRRPTRRCPVCAEVVLAAARECRFCHALLPARSTEEKTADRVSELRTDLISPSAPLREEAIIALYEMGADGLPALSDLQTLRADPDRQVRARAAWAIEELTRRAKAAVSAA